MRKSLLWNDLYSFVAFSAVTVETQPFSLNISNKVPKHFSIILLGTMPRRISEKEKTALVNLFFSRERSQSFSMNYARTLWAAFLNLCTSFWFTVGNLLIKDSAPKSNIYWCWQLKIFFLTQINEIILTTVVLVFRTLGLTFVLLYRLWYSLYNISFNFS